MYTIRILRRTDHTPTDYDGKYLVDYDPAADDEDNEGENWPHLTVAEHAEDARKFESDIDAYNFYLSEPAHRCFAVEIRSLAPPEPPPAAEPPAEQPEGKPPEEPRGV